MSDMGPLQLTPEQVTKVAHAANNALREHLGEQQNQPWDTYSDADKRITIARLYQVVHGYTDREIHTWWVDSMRATGWVHGDTLDVAARRHPLLIPYDQLSATSRVKDTLYRVIVQALTGRHQQEEN